MKYYTSLTEYNAGVELHSKGQESHIKADAAGELAQHNKAHRFSCVGKCGGRAGKQRVLTWGDPGSGNPDRGVSRGHSSDEVRENGWSEGPNRTGTFRPIGGCRGHSSRWLKSGKSRHDGKHGDVRR